MATGSWRVAASQIVLATLILAAAAVSPATAQQLTPTESARLLAKAGALDTKCDVLQPAEGDALKGFVAQAEIAAAGSAGPDVASAAVAEGEAEGSAASCSNDNVRLVRSAYSSARVAASRPGRSAAAEPMPQPPRRGSDRQGAIAVAPMVDALERYSLRLEAYYLDLRCRHLPHPDAVNFWRSINHDQRAASRENGSAAVGAAQARARAAAASFRWCGWNTARRVMAGYRAQFAP